MAAGDDYRIKAADISAKARRELRPLARTELEKLALAYLRLADQADRNAGHEAPHGSPADPSAAPLQQQQQQQPQANRPHGNDAE